MAGASHFPEALASELQALGSIFVSEGEFSVQELDPGGDYCCVVQLHPEDLDIGLQLSIPETYPKTVPKLEILPKGGATEFSDDPLLAELLQKMYQAARDSAGEAMMYSLVDVAREWLEGRTVRAEEDEDQEGAAGTDDVDTKSVRIPDDKKDMGDEEEDYQKKGKKKGNKKAVDEGLGLDKKPRMKTASEVISRIQWDKQLEQEDFIVGYLDRFVGVIEKPFTAFSWVDVATVDDYDTLAIPRHRIQYFKYKDQTVWDKTERLDDVFGSTGSGKTILSTMEMFSKENQSVEEKETNDEVGHEADKDEGKSPSLELATAAPWRVRQNKDFTRPNFFFAVRITDPVIIRCVSRIQEAVCEKNPLLEEACTRLSTLHITLCLLRLDTPQEKSQAVGILKSLQEDISSVLSPVTKLRFQGLGQFSKRVLYSPPDKVSLPKLTKLSQILQAAIKKAGLNPAGNRSKYSPHMTLLKMYRPTDSTFVDPELYERFIHAFIGVQPINTIHLCSMGDDKRSDGFYYCLDSMDVQSEH